MKVIDPGHEYDLDSIDGYQENRLVFVKREGDKYPGNVGHHAGTTIQEVLRALIERCVYVNGQTWCEETDFVVKSLVKCLVALEVRAARRHGREVDFNDVDCVLGWEKCRLCGHIKCYEKCRQ